MSDNELYKVAYWETQWDEWNPADTQKQCPVCAASFSVSTFDNHYLSCFKKDEEERIAREREAELRKYLNSLLE